MIVLSEKAAIFEASCPNIDDIEYVKSDKVGVK